EQARWASQSARMLDKLTLELIHAGGMSVRDIQAITLNKRYQVTTDYVDLIKRAARGDYGDVAVAGPMDVKTACDAESASIKKIGSEVVGDADVLIMPDLEASNTFYNLKVYPQKEYCKK
ncbi:MAG: hypothetical protein K2I88_03635, partial [Anaeroplasmataceae bacterium]|nr:hypothetical protein [Anaeroplasmataceae bacterium]